MAPTDGPHLANRFRSTFAPPVIVTAPAREPARRGPLTGPAAFVALVVLGLALRAAALTGGRDLWIDEAMLALNLVGRSPGQLLVPLDWNQGAPVGFLLLAKLAVEALGPTEFALRLVPFLGSVVGLVAFAWVAPRLLPRPAAALAVGLCAVSPFLISYAVECKQYSTDAALAAGLLAMSAGLLSGADGFRRWAVLAAAGAAAVWVSHPAAFVLGGIGAALLAEAVWNRDGKRFWAAAATATCWLVSFGVSYVLCLRQLGSNQYLLDYWAGHFLPLPPTSVGDLAWLADHFFAFFHFPGGLGGTEIRAGGIAAVLFLVGAWGFARDRWPVAVALVLPAVLALLASGVHKYPFSGRLLLFLVPLALLVVARGAWMVGSALRPSQPAAAALLTGVLAAAPVLETVQELREPTRYEQLTEVLAEVRADWQPGDRVYVYYGAAPAFAFYSREQGFPPGAVVRGSELRGSRTAYRDELAKLKGHPRVWLVFSHRHADEEGLIRAYAEAMGECKREVRAAGAAAYLFDLSGTTGTTR
jgi:hypothetical protein